MYCTHTWVIFKNLSDISPIIKLAVEQAGPRIISFGGCDGSVSLIRWCSDEIDEHYNETIYHQINLLATPYASIILVAIQSYGLLCGKSSSKHNSYIASKNIDRA